MASYEDIRVFFDESRLLRDAAEKAADVPIVTGFALDIDSLWILLYDHQFGNLDFSPDPSWSSDHRYDPDPVFSTPGGFGPFGYRRRDLFARVDIWEKLAGEYEATTGRRRLPVVMTIIHRPLQIKSAQPDDDEASLRELVRITRDAAVALRIEERPRARLALASGGNITVGANKTGTLGGVLDDKTNGIAYGITCGHVAQKNDAVYDGGAQIGLCTADTARVTLTASRVCDPVTLAAPSPMPGNGPQVNMLDCALIELSAIVTRPAISGIAGVLSPGQKVVLTGAATGTSHHHLGSLCISYAFTGGGQNYCFRDAIELLPRRYGLLGRRTVPTQGDSGGWVLTDARPQEWAGLFFGEDGNRGFAIRSEWVHRWAEDSTGVALTP